MMIQVNDPRHRGARVQLTRTGGRWLVSAVLFW
jgi:hypothetical protein